MRGHVGPSHPLVEGRTGRGVRIAVVDSGIHADHPHVGGVAGCVAFDDRGRRHDDVVDRLGHGTAVAAAVHEKAPDAELLVVKVFDATLSTTVTALREALAWASLEGAVRLVNLSLGTPKPEHAEVLAPVVSELAGKGCFVVTPFGHAGATWWPGALPDAVGVTLDWGVERDALGIDADGGRFRVSASGYPRPIPGVSPERNLKGISFAAANATGFLARVLEGRGDVATTAELAALFDDV